MSAVEDRVLADVAAEVTRAGELWGLQTDLQDNTGRGSAYALFAALVETADVFRREGDLPQHVRDIRDGWLRGSGSGAPWPVVLITEIVDALEEPDPEKLRGELLQVAAVVVRWASAIDRRIGTGAGLAETISGPRVTVEMSPDETVAARHALTLLLHDPVMSRWHPAGRALQARLDAIPPTEDAQI